jgi:hypothetical protein
MATISLDPTPLPLRPAASTAAWVGRGLIVTALAAFAFTAVAPIGASIVTVFLFAGPHNWFEARYFLRRLPPRWRTMRTYFATGFLGAIGLTAGFALLPTAAAQGWGTAGPWDEAQWLNGIRVWNVALVVWGASLAWQRRRMSPTRSWPWLLPIAAALAVAGWCLPRMWGVALVYTHPLVALWFLDREVGKLGPAAQSAYRRAVVVVPILALLLIGVTADAPPLLGTDVLTARITWHAGTDLFGFVSNRCPVALHVFLETIHYGVWIVLLPLVALRGKPWSLQDVPLAHRSLGWKRVVAAVLVAGVVVSLVLWCGFAIDYPLTRDVYFTVAVLHVLAEVPFLLRLH